MNTVEEYPLTTTRMIAWDSPSTWGTSSTSTSTTSQPLTANNLSAYVEAQSSTIVNSKDDIMTRYYSSMKSNQFETQRLSPKSSNSHDDDSTQSPSVPLSTPTKNVAIDAHPLPFPYHNDCTFLPTVETGRTRFDSESTQNLYDSQPSSPTLSAFSSNKRHIYSTSRGSGLSPSLSPSRHIHGHQRYQRGSNNSHYSIVTTATEATHTTSITKKKMAQRHVSFQSTKKRLNTLINNNRYIPNGAQRRLSMLLANNDEMTPFDQVKQQQTYPSDQESPLTNLSKKAIYGQNEHLSQPTLSTIVLYDYYQSSSTSSQYHRTVAAPCFMERERNTSNSLSSSPPHSHVTSYTYTTDNSDIPTVISSSTFPHDESSVWQNQLVYMASPSDQYHLRNNKSTPSYHRKDGFFTRFARKLWPFRHV